MTVQITWASENFSRWSELLQLLHEAFAYMDTRIDPPSSVHRLTPESLASKSQEETLFLAADDGALVGCVFARLQNDALYVSKFAVRPDRQGAGISRRLKNAVEQHARDIGVRHLDLDTRIELTENHATFAAMGYIKVAESSHQGYDHPTSVKMRKKLTASDHS
jgi:GNAT superfamily N-acetyltransferase